MADNDSPFVRNEDAARHAAGVGVLGKILGLMGLDESGARAATPWREALENTLGAPSIINMVADTGEAAQRLTESPFLPSEDPRKALDALAVAGAAQTGAFAAAPFRPAGSLGAGGSGVARPQLNSLGFYSQAEHAARNLIPMKKGNPQQWINALKKQGVKDAELEWTGFKRFIEGKKELTRDEVAEFFERNRVQVGRRSLDEDGVDEDSVYQAAYENELERLKQDFDDRFEIRETGDPESLSPFELIDKHSDESLGEFGTYGNAYDAGVRRFQFEADQYVHTTPLDELMEREGLTPGAKWNEEDYRYRRGDADSDSYVETLYTLNRSGRQQPPFQSGHWEGIPNVLAHTRGDTRDVYGGGAARYLDELQSDWSQLLRQYGVAMPREALERLSRERDAIREQFENLHARYRAIDNAEGEQEYWDLGDGATEARQLSVALRSQLQHLRQSRHNLEILINEAANDTSPQEVRMRARAIEIAKRDLAEAEALVKRTEEQLHAAGARRLEGDEREAFLARDSEMSRLNAELGQQVMAGKRGVPDSPFAKTSDWTRMALQAELYDAAHNPSLTHLAWSPGRIQLDRWGNEGLVPFYDETIPKVIQKLMRQHDPKHPGVTEVPLGGPRPFVFDARDRLEESSSMPAGPRAISRLSHEMGQGYLPRFEMDEPPAGVVMAPFSPANHRIATRPGADLWPSYSLATEQHFRRPSGHWDTGGLYGRFRDREHAEKVMREAQEHFASGAAEPERFPAVELTETFRKNLLDKGWPLFSAGPSPFMLAQPGASMGYMESGVPGTVLEEVY